MVEEINPMEAWEILQSDNNAILLDVRSSMEYEYVGHPVNAIHVPWKEAPEWNITPDFTGKVRERLANSRNRDTKAEDLTVLTICRSGKRSFSAASALVNEGFLRVYNIAEGFEGDLDENKHRNTINGWRFRDLPWEQS